MNTKQKKRGYSASGFKGVYKKGNKWQAKINLHGKDISVGCFDDKEVAAQHFDYHMLKNYGENVYLNFPNKDYSNFQSNCNKRKLNYKLAENIRKQKREGVSPKVLSQQYQVTLATIYRVVANVYYPAKDFAKVNVNYNPLRGS